MKIKNLNLKDTNLILRNETIAFDKDGVAEVRDDQAKDLLKLKGYESLEKRGEPETKDKEPKGKEAPKAKEDYSKLKLNEVKKALDDKNIKYDPKANKAELVKLLEEN